MNTLDENTSVSTYQNMYTNLGVIFPISGDYFKRTIPTWNSPSFIDDEVV